MPGSGFMNDRIVCGNPNSARFVLGLFRPGLRAEGVEPKSVSTVRADLQFQIFQRIDHPLVFVIVLQQRIGFDHALDQFRGTADFPVFGSIGIGIPFRCIT